MAKKLKEILAGSTASMEERPPMKWWIVKSRGNLTPVLRN